MTITLNKLKLNLNSKVFLVKNKFELNHYTYFGSEGILFMQGFSSIYTKSKLFQNWDCSFL